MAQVKDIDFANLNIRVPVELRARLKRSAKQCSRTISGQARFFLETQLKHMDDDNESIPKAA